MCKAKKYHGTSNTKIDKCMLPVLDTLNGGLLPHLKVVACCCGHSKYIMSIIMYNTKDCVFWEIMSGITIMRKRRFYKRDKQGYYYIPEVVNTS